MTDSEKCIKCGMVATGYRYYDEETGRHECADCVVTERDRLEARVKELEKKLSDEIENHQITLDVLNGSSSHEYMDKFRTIDIDDYERRKAENDELKTCVQELEAQVDQMRSDLEAEAREGARLACELHEATYRLDARSARSIRERLGWKEPSEAQQDANLDFNLNAPTPKEGEGDTDD